MKINSSASSSVTNLLRSSALSTLGVILVGSLLTGCQMKSKEEAAESRSGGGSAETKSGELSGQIEIDGSSTVYPISQAVAEEFQKIHPEVQVAIASSGTGGGFKRFVLGEVDINDASRPIKDSEIALCKENGVEYIELKVAIDGISVVVNSENDWADCLTVDELHRIWQPGSKVKLWSDVRSDWPKEEIKLYGADTDSGTFDYFTEVINGEEGASRTDYSPSADDNALVIGVAGDKYALGYFGYAYYVENRDQLNAVAISAAEDRSQCVKPTDANIEDGKYAPLSRPLFLYVNKESLSKSEVRAFLEYYLNEGQQLVGEVGYVKLSSSTLAESRQALQEALPEK